ncbi:MAG: site-specific integrase, partial [Dermatophilaceae bacterium]
MRHGSVSQRHTRACPRNPDGSFAPHRCKGSWQWVLEYGRDSTGKRMQTSRAGFPTKAAAQSALKEAVQTLLADVHITDITMADYLNRWLTGKHALRPKTATLYGELAHNYLIPHLGRVRLLDLRAHHLDRMYAAITTGKSGRPLSPSTIRRIHGVLRSALNTAVKRRLIPYNPADHIELAPENPQRPKEWTATECQRFLTVCADDRLIALYHLMIVTGMRRGEAVGLRWEDVDLDGEYLQVVQQITDVNGRSVLGTPKSRKGDRLVQLDGDTVAVLRRHRDRQDAERRAWGSAWQDSGYVFTREDGSALRPEYVTRHFAHLSRRASLRPIRLHDLRHTSASLALDAGVDLKVVSDRLGHSQIGVTADLYAHVNRRLGKAASEQIAATLRPGSETLPAPFLPHEPQDGPRPTGEPNESDPASTAS